jgi:hypothetical protein
MKDEKTEQRGTTQSSAASAEDPVEKALAFARDTARDEIASIDRLHKRTLTALGVQVAAFGLLFSVLGWVGYSNLKRVAVQTATDEVKERLADELTKKNIDIAVQQALREHATDQITQAIQDQVAIAITKRLADEAPELRAQTQSMTAKAVASLQPQIEAFARQQAMDLIVKTYEPRRLDPAQRAALSAYAQKVAPFTVNVAVGGDPEAQHYEEQISQSLEAGGWRVMRQALLGSRLDFPSYGLVVATTPELQGSSTVRELMNCLQAAKLRPQLIVSSEPAEWGPQTTLIVLPKAK